MTEKKNSLADEVYDHLLRQMLEQTLTYGQKIQEEELSKTLNISRTPIREAVRRLEADGLIKILPKRFAQVVTMDEEDKQQLGLVRLNLACLTAQLAAFHGSNADFLELERINEELGVCLDKGDRIGGLEKDMEFHNAYAKISRNRVLIHCQAQLQLRISLLQASELKKNPHLMIHSVEEHNQTIQALYDRDVTKVLDSIIVHISDFYGLKADIYTMSLTDFGGGRMNMPGTRHRPDYRET